MNKSNKFSPEVCERPARMVLSTALNIHQIGHRSTTRQWKAAGIP
jgi:hypothetical protein